LILGQGGSDRIDGGAGSDMAQFESAVTADLSTGTANEGGSDVLVAIENLKGSDSADTLIGDAGNNLIEGQGGDDVLIGNGGNDMLYGRHGNDTLNGGSGADIMDGGPENDTAVYDSPINANLTTGSASDGDSLAGIENLTGSSGNDVLTGDGNANVLIGGAGADILDGQGGTDTCDGGLPVFRETDACSNCEMASSCYLQ
jgi:hypothetical protein